ncbi:MAG: four helix bundle protein [Microcoleaceae cyanobacterium]
MENSSIKSYQDLQVWQEAMNLVESCYHITQSFPQQEMYGMISQIRRASVSIPANIAEGYGRSNLGDYIRFLYIAQGSLKELETHLILSKRVNLTTIQVVQPVLDECETVGRLLLALIRALNRKRER